MQRTLFRHAALQSLFVVVLLFHGGLSSAQEMTPSAAGDPCLAAPGAGTPWPIGPGMMQTPGAMGPGMMTPGAMGPGMMGDVNLMVATMLLANDRIDEALSQAALSRVERPEIKQFAQDVAQTRNDEGTQLEGWRERVYPGMPMMPLDQMLTVMAGMMGPMMQGTPWPGMGQMPGVMMGNPLAALCAASGPVDGLFVDSLLARDQMVLAMLGMMQPTVSDTDLQQVVRDAVTSRQQELDRLQAWQQSGSTTASAGTPSAAATAASATIESYDIYFEPKELTIPAGTDVTVTLPNDGMTLHNFSIDALDINVDIAPGETKTVTINAPAGSYEYYCNVPGHKPAGMVGTLTVQ